VDAVLAAREAHRGQGAEDQKGCRNQAHRSRIGTGPDGLKSTALGCSA
jgi:hypothetical protein